MKSSVLFAVLFTEFLIGIEIGWTAPIIVKLKNGETGLVVTNEEISWIASLHDIGRIFGPLFSTLLLDNVGRKATVIICTLLFSILWLAVVFAHSVLIICLLRILLGAVQGLSEVASSIYIVENCAAHIRGIIGSFLPLCFFAAMIFQYSLAASVSYTTVSSGK